MSDGTSSGETTHDLLLALAGRVDDDLLGRARELVAVGEDARAVELVTASLVAAGAALPEPVRSAVVDAATSARIDIDTAAALPTAAPEDGTEHRFKAPRDGVPVADALRALPARSLAGCQVLLALRRTPAGSAPGPLPHPVLLVLAPPGRPTEVLAYQVGVALERTGIYASVEVLTAGVEPTGYHAAALRDAVPVISTDDPADGSTEDDRGRRALRREPEDPRRVPDTTGLLGPPDTPGDEPGSLFMSTHRSDYQAESQHREPERREPERAAAVVDEPDTHLDGTGFETSDPTVANLPDRRRIRDAPDQQRTVPVRDDNQRAAPRPISPGRTRRPSVTPISRATGRNPIPLGRRNGPAPVARPLSPVQPPAERDADDRYRERDVDGGTNEAPDTPVPEQGRRRRGGGVAAAFSTPFAASPNDPLNGPLNEPLMDPLLDPTPPDADTSGAGRRRLAEDRQRPARAPEDDWSEDWIAGTWAMAPSAIDRPSPRRIPDGAPAPPVDEQATSRTQPRHQHEDRPEATPDGPPAERETPPARPEGHAERGPEPELDGSNLGLRPESVARLSDADRQLLARLQAELNDGRKPRVTRRAGIGNSFGPGPGGPGNNGHNGTGNNGAGNNGAGNGRPHTNGHPPDLAG